MRINLRKMELEMARQCIDAPEMARKMGLASSTVNNLLQRRSTQRHNHKVIGKVAFALGMEIEDIIIEEKEEKERWSVS